MPVLQPILKIKDDFGGGQRAEDDDLPPGLSIYQVIKIIDVTLQYLSSHYKISLLISFITKKGEDVRRVCDVVYVPAFLLVCLCVLVGQQMS